MAKQVKFGLEYHDGIGIELYDDRGHVREYSPNQGIKCNSRSGNEKIIHTKCMYIMREYPEWFFARRKCDKVRTEHDMVIMFEEILGPIVLEKSEDKEEPKDSEQAIIRKKYAFIMREHAEWATVRIKNNEANSKRELVSMFERYNHLIVI